MSWTDEQIDKLYQENAEKASFDYKNEYWQEMDAVLASTGASSALTDEQLDNMYQESADQSAFDYKPEYWNEIESMLPASEIVPVEVEAADVDALYQAKSSEISFAYKPEYFSDIDALLPVSAWRSIDVAWFITAFVFIGLLLLTPITRGDLHSNHETIQLLGQEGAANDIEVGIQNETINSSVNSTSNSIVNPTAQNEISSHSNDIDNRLNTNASRNSSESNETKMNNDGNPASNDIASHNLNETNATNNHNSSQDDGSNSVGVVSNDNTNSEVDSNSSISDNTTSEEIDLETVTLNDEGTITNAYNTDDQLKLNSDVGMLPLKDLTTNTLVAELINKEYKFDFKMPARTSLYVEAIGGVSQSLISPSDVASYSYGAGLGLQIQKGKFVFVLGANGIISNHKDILLSRQAKVYGFGSEVYSYELNYKQLYIVEGNLSFGYKFGRHGINIAVKPSYVVNSKVGMLDNSAGDEASERDYYGYMEGINRFGIKPSVGYSFDINNKWMIGLNIGTQVMPSVNEEFINGVNNKLPIDGQIYLRRSFSLKR